jgi:prepilin-type N-terminal cleavage/methylation domain-containing protein
MRTKFQDGFTLTEVMVASAILAMFIVGCYKMVEGALWMNQAARDHYVAVNMADSRLERARNLQYATYSDLLETQLVMAADGTPSVTGPFRRTTSVNTNYGVVLTEFVVQVDIRNHKTGAFDGINELLATVLPSKQ